METEALPLRLPSQYSRSGPMSWNESRFLGPEGKVTMDGKGPRSCRHPTRPLYWASVRGILRDWLESEPVLRTIRKALPEPGLVVVSRGVPALSSWSVLSSAEAPTP